jgi:serine/threonine protein kinase
MPYHLPFLAAIMMSTTNAWTTLPATGTAPRRSTTFLKYDANSAAQQANLPMIGNTLHDKPDNQEGTTVEEIEANYIASDEDGDASIKTFKSEVFKAFRKDETTGEPIGDEVVIKISSNHQGMERESQNYDELDSDLFVGKHEFYEPAHEGDASVIVMESGETDLTRYITARAPMSIEDVREKAKGVVDILVELHGKDVVWTEVKTCNFVILDSGEVRGIDLEAATYAGTPNIMHTAAGTPPEFAVEHLVGRNVQMHLSFDVWSVGMVLYHLAVGEHYFAPRFELTDFVRIFTYLKNHESLKFSKLEAKYTDPLLKELIVSCLQFEPTARPTIQQVRDHPFFSATR